jgi:hypothetical protein
MFLPGTRLEPERAGIKATQEGGEFVGFIEFIESDNKVSLK